jgi:hypothetical protein
VAFKVTVPLGPIEKGVAPPSLSVGFKAPSVKLFEGVRFPETVEVVDKVPFTVSNPLVILTTPLFCFELPPFPTLVP